MTNSTCGKGIMRFIFKVSLAAASAASLAMAAGGSGGGGGTGGGGGGGGVATPGLAEVRLFSETIPAGGTVQVQVGLTNPRPIMGGGGNFFMSDMMDDVFGISLFSPAGDAFGVAALSAGKVSVTIASPLA